MTRWEPDARGRLEEAALSLYAERGFDNTTVAEIAARAGLTERTFFRYFADKREVLFWGAADFQQLFVNAVAGAPDSAGPLEAVAAALDAVGVMFQPRRAHSRQRQAVIDANAGLHERELIKLALLGTAISDALRGRGVADSTANLSAQAGVTVFKIAFDRWVKGEEKLDLSQLIKECFDELKALTGS